MMKAREKLQKAAELLADTSRDARLDAYELMLEAYQEAPGEFSMVEAALIHSTIMPLVEAIENGMVKMPNARGAA
jgi:hypothetical protein